MAEQKKAMRTEMLLYFILIILATLGNGLSDSVYGNYFKEVYNVDSVGRGFIEFPRELPGLLCVLIITGLSFLGDIKMALIAQISAFAGLTVLGFTTPSFGIMLIFLFINSLGMHMFMPLQDSIGMSLAEPDKVGSRMGQYAAVKAAMTFLAALAAFVGFRTGFFSFTTPIKTVFVAGAAFFLAAIVVSLMLIRQMKDQNVQKRKFKLILRKEYIYYYLLTILHGVKKQITYVYGSWVIIDILLKGADVMSVLYMVSGFISIFFMKQVGKWADKYGIKVMMLVEAIAFIAIYLVYGFMVWGMSSEVLSTRGISVLIIYTLFTLDRLSMQIGMIRSVYLRSIAVDKSEITAVLSTGTSMDHVVSIIAAMIGGYIWAQWGSQWVFFIAAFLSLGNLYVAYKIKPQNRVASEQAV